MALAPQEALRAAGISPAGGPLPPAVRGACGGLARRLRGLGLHAIGLVPAGDGVAVPAVALELGRALADRTVGLVGVLDGDATWPCAPALTGADVRRDGRLAATGWLGENLAVLTPYASADATALQLLRDILDREGAAFHHLIVDLTGFDHAGEHLAACALVDAVVLVARAGESTVRDVQRWRRELGERDLGVLLTGV